MKHAFISEYGNAAPTAPGLRIGAPQDIFEREADRAASEVMGGRGRLAWSLSSVGIGAALQRKCSCGGSGGAEGDCEECKKKEMLQRRAAEGTTPSHVPLIVHDVLSSPGQALDSSTRGFMEARFGHDFSQVRIHDDGRAAASAATVNALAYTVGSEVVFGAGRYQPSSPEGRRLIAHELTHVVQQRGASARQGVVDDPAAEFEAERNAHALGTDGAPSVRHSSGRGALQRQQPGGGSGGGLDADDQKIVDTAQHEASSFHCNVGPIIWGILKKHFPDDTRKVAGAGCEEALPGLRTEFSTTDPAHPKVTRSVPMIYVGKAFVASTDSAHLKDRVAEVANQIQAIDDWRLAKFLIDEKDLQNPRISGQLRSMSAGQLIDYRDKTKDNEVKRYAENLITFSTPLQKGSAVDPLSGNTVMLVNGVNVSIQPDVHGAAGVTGGDTSAKFEFNPPRSPSYQTDSTGLVTGFPGYAPTGSLTITTSYGAGIQPEGASGYGRGTTKEDIANKATALRVHEGSHGEDYIDYVRSHPLPVFAGKNGDKAADFDKAQAAYLAAVSTWMAGLKAVKKTTDCVGKTIDQFHRGERGYTPVCP
ncbi:MAG: DUF4157 domain-containing protein [Terriglobia bacterium]|jgi:hypothetical protein